MEILRRVVVVALDESDAARFGRQLVEVIRLGYVARGATPPRLLVEVANEVSGAARGSAGSACSPRPGAVAELRNTAGGPVLAGCDQPVRVTVAEAARIAEVSASYLRRLIRRGDTELSRGQQSAPYLVSTDDLAAWLRRRRVEIERKAT